MLSPCDLFLKRTSLGSFTHEDVRDSGLRLLFRLQLLKRRFALLRLDLLVAALITLLQSWSGVPGSRLLF